MIINESKLTIETFDGRGFTTISGQPFQPLVHIFCEKQKFTLGVPTTKGNSFDWGERIAM
jgi:hypothetical protein